MRFVSFSYETIIFFLLEKQCVFYEVRNEFVNTNYVN
jgi:hypothetical protein